MFWVSSERSIRDSVKNAMTLAKERGYRSIAFPLIGAGTGGGKVQKVASLMEAELRNIEFDGEVRLVEHKRTAGWQHRRPFLKSHAERCRFWRFPLRIRHPGFRQR